MQRIRNVFMAAAAIAFTSCYPAYATPGSHVPTEELRAIVAEMAPEPVVVEREVEVERVVEVEVPPAMAEQIVVSWSRVDDGSCPEVGNAVSGSYTVSSDHMTVDANLRVAPSGGDCRVDGISYNATVARFVPVGDWEGFVQFQASRHSTSAPYALVDAAGNVMTRPDGGPSDPVVLPAGAAEDLGFVVGGARDITESFNVRVGLNLVPVDWAGGVEDSRTLHAGFTMTALPFDVPVVSDNIDSFRFEASADFGEDVFGSASVSVTKGWVNATYRYNFGLDAVDAGVPERQTFAGLPVVVQGAPQGTSSAFEVGVVVPF